MTDEIPKNCRRFRTPLACAILIVTAAGITSCKPPEVTGSAEDLLERAWRNFRVDEFDRARGEFNAVMKTLDALKSAGKPHALDFKFRINALYGLGLIECFSRANSQLGSPEKYLNQIIALAPGSDMAAWAELALVRNRHIPATSTEAINIHALRKDYEALVAKYPGTPASHEAFVYEQSLYVQTLTAEDATSAVAAINAYLEKYPNVPLRSALYSLRSTACITLNQYRPALDSALLALETKEIDPTNPTLNNMMDYYKIALIAEYDVGDFAVARRFFNLFLEQYPIDQRAFTVRRELERMDRVERNAREGRPLLDEPATAPASRPATSGGNS